MPHEYSSDSSVRDTSVLKHSLFVVGHLPMPARVAATTASCGAVISMAHAWKKKCAMSVGSLTRGGKQPRSFRKCDCARACNHTVIATRHPRQCIT